MKKIIFLCNWGETPEQLLKRYSSQTPGQSGKWGNVIGVIEALTKARNVVLDEFNIWGVINKKIKTI